MSASSPPPASLPTLADVREARARIGEAVYQSPCARSQILSERFHCDVYLKLENLQMTGSFKERGARNKLLCLDQDARAAGVIAASAGNHAQGLAYAARSLGVAATIVMPATTPLVKVSSTRGFGAEVILHGQSYAEAQEHAEALCRQRGLTRVPAFDDDAVIAGQGTVGLEILEQVPDLDTVVVPVGGGGLLSGIAVVMGALRPGVALYGAEAAAVPSLSLALEHGRPVQAVDRPTLADGIAVRRVGERPFAILKDQLAGVVTVSDEEIAEAVLVLLEREKTVAEGAGAAALAALLQGRIDVAGRRVVVVLSGGNIDVNLVSRIIDRGLHKSGRAARMRVLLPDVPGALVELLSIVAGCGANVMQVVHDRLDLETRLGDAAVELLLETRGFEHVAEVEAAISAAGYRRG